jgi:polyhydroxyalkanoate synthesis regulator phasin
MELDIRMLVQLGAVVASLSGAWALVRSQVATLKAGQEEIKKWIDELNRELDTAEQNVSVLRQQIGVLSDILSPNNLAAENKRKGVVAAEINQLKEDVRKLAHMHNGKHPPIKE